MTDRETERLTYFIITRKLFKSAIWRDNPHVLKLFLYLIGMARHRRQPKKFPGFEVNRGELVTSLQIICDDNQYIENRKIRKWNRMRVSRMLSYLEKNEYINIIRDTYGTHIKVLNYDKYQSPERYKCDNNVTEVLQQRYDYVTEVLPYNNDKNVNNDNNDNKISENFVPPSGEKLKSNGHDWIEVELWDNFVEFRNEIKKPISKTAVNFLLDVLKQNKGDQKQIIANSIAGGYPALYPIKKKDGSNGWDDLRKEFSEDEKKRSD